MHHTVAIHVVTSDDDLSLKGLSHGERAKPATFEDIRRLSVLKKGNNSNSRYKPRIAEEVPDEDPSDLIRDVLAIEREITVGIERLLSEVEQ